MFVWTSPKKKTWFERFSEQPHQLFFASTLFCALFLMIYSMFAMITNHGDFSLVHGFGLIYGVFVNAFLGFLLTVIPKYTQSVLIKRYDYVAIWVLFEVGILITLVISELFGKAILGASLLFAFVVFIDILAQARIKNQQESLWLVGFVLISSTIFFSNLFFDTELIHTSLWFVVFPLVFTVAQRMIPAFFAVYFKENVQEKPLWFLPIFIVPMWVIGFFGMTHSVSLYATLFLSIATLLFLFKSNILRKSPPILMILTVGFCWLPIGFLTLLYENYIQGYTLQLGIHILTLGFVFTLLIGFGTRVILGHSGQKIQTDKVSVFLFILTQIVIISRILGSLFYIFDGSVWIGLVHLGFVLWIVVFIIWGIRFHKEIFTI